MQRSKMPSRIFRFYSLEPEDVFRMVGDRWPRAIVRRSGWKVGGSPVFQVTIVLDDSQAAAEFEQWLVCNAPRRNIRPYVGRAGRDAAGAAYGDVRLHSGALASRLKLPVVSLWRDLGRYWLDLRLSALRLWLHLKS